MTPRRTRFRHTARAPRGGVTRAVRATADALHVVGHAETGRTPAVAVRSLAGRHGRSATSRASAAGSQATYATARGAGPRSARHDPRHRRRPAAGRARPGRRRASAGWPAPAPRRTCTTVTVVRSRRHSPARARPPPASASTTVIRPAPSDVRGQRGGEQPDAAVEVPGPLARPRREQLHDGRRRACRRRPGAPARTAGRVELPVRGRPRARVTRAGPDEPAPRRPGPAGRARSTSPSAAATTSTASSVRPAPVEHRRRRAPPGGRSGTRSTGTTSCERCLSSPARPVGVHCVLHPGPPAQARPAPPPGSGSTRDAQRVHLGRGPARPSRVSCSRTHGRLQLALGRRRRRAGSRSRRSGPGPANGHGGATRSGDGREHLDRVGAQEALALLGDHRPDPLAGQRVPDEDDPPVGARATQCPPWATGADRRARARVALAGPARPRASSGSRLVGPGAPRPPRGLAGAAIVRSAPAPSSGRRPVVARGRARPAGRAAGAGRAPRSNRSRSLVDAGGELPRHAGHHHARLEQQPALDPQRALVVQQVLPPLADHVLRDEDGDHVARASRGAATSRSR